MVCRAHIGDWLRVGLAMLLHPVAEGPGVDRQLPGDLGDRAVTLQDQLHRFGLELRTEPPPRTRCHSLDPLSSRGLSKNLGTPHKADDAKRLKELEKQNATLKRLLAEAELEKAVLKELAEGNF